MKVNKIKKYLRDIVSEDRVPGIHVTQKNQKESEKSNKQYNKDVKKKMSDYEKDTIKNDKEEEDHVDKKFTADGKEKEYHDEMEILNGMEMLTYDQPPTEKFKERSDKAIAGHSSTGNKTYTGKWDPETGEGNGNTESVWGASSDDFGQKHLDKINRSFDKRKDSEDRGLTFGNDYERVDAKSDSNVKTNNSNKKRKAFEGENKKNELMDGKIKKLTFKKPFKGEENVLKLIPENYRVDNKKFIMTDGNETYKIRWEGNVNEGEAIVLDSENKKVISEDMSKIKKLMNFKSNNGSIKVKDKLNENKEFNKIYNKVKKK